VSFLTVNLGFFQAFHNFLGIRDNFRQTYVDLMSWCGCCTATPSTAPSARR
jgi:hypothetical protein